ncbi:RES domain-containing protein [Mesorhizobium sp. M0768]|uniref:RES family NAD+ phosphorylase n=1 Tax=Mesorhizobium sp. M0768 TaxID=2956996 RepID=UPI003339BCFB
MGFKPTSGDGAAIRGAQFNPKGVPALYLALTVMTAVKEANQGFAHRINPCVLCSYEVDCDDVADLTMEPARGEFSIAVEHMACAWATALSMETARRHGPFGLRRRGILGILVPSFAPGAETQDRNLVWTSCPGDKTRGRAGGVFGCRRRAKLSGRYQSPTSIEF